MNSDTDDSGFTPIPDERYWNMMRRGHLLRTGHELDGYVTEDDDGTLVLTRTCACAERGY